MFSLGWNSAWFFLIPSYPNQLKTTVYNDGIVGNFPSSAGQLINSIIIESEKSQSKLEWHPRG